MIGILYESKEWSSYALLKNIEDMGVSARLIDMQEEQRAETLLSYDMIVNRVFASAVFRGHQKALNQMPSIIRFLQKNCIPMINPPDAHFYEIRKELSTTTLAAHGFMAPQVYGVFSPKQMAAAEGICYPCVIKPDCGGRTNYTYIVNDIDELRRCMSEAPDIRFIAEDYIYPEYGFLTRIEVIGGRCALIVKRSVTETGLSAYHLGSVYSPYPDCGDDIKDAAVRAMGVLQIETGSLDIIENKNGFFIIDVNSVSNASEDNTEMFHFDLMKETAAYIVKRYRETPSSFRA